jgi:DHA1 family tetracycline resistance protein-like MFS transporter
VTGRYDERILTLMTNRKRQAGVPFVLVVLFLDILGIGIIIPVLPQLVDDFLPGGPSEAAFTYSAIAALYALMQFLFAPLLGALSDRFGRRTVILVALAGFSLSYLILAWSPTLAWLVVGRILAGITGATITTVNAYIADVSTKETRARNFGFVGVAFGLGFIFGPAIGGLLGDFGLRVPFLASAAVAAVGWVYGLLVLPESLPPERRAAFDWKRIDPVRSLAGLKAYPIVAGLAVGFMFFGLAQRGLETVFVLYTDYRFAWGPAENGWALAVVGVTAAIVQGLLVRPLVARIGERRTVVVGLMVYAAGFVAYGFTSVGSWFYVVIAVTAFGNVSGPAIQGLIAGAVPSSDQGRVQGAITSLLSLTAIVAPLISGALFGAFSGADARAEVPGMPFFAGAVFIGVALVVVLVSLRRFPAEPSAPAAG